MTNLADLQRRFQARVLHGDDTVVAEIVSTPEGDAATRIDVYTDAYRLRLVELLGNERPALRRLVGDERFDTLCRAYIGRHPSSFHNVRWYGDRLEAFLSSTLPWSAEPALAEMAALDEDLALAFDAADEAQLSVARLAVLPPDQWPDLLLRRAAHVRVRTFACNVEAVRRAFDLGEAPPACGPLDVPIACAIWRRDLGGRYRALDRDEAAVAPMLAQGMTFSDLCERLLEWHAADDVAMRAMQLLRTWVEDQWLLDLL